MFFSTLGASTRSRARLMRAKALAERAVVESSLEHTVFAPSIVYAPGDPFLALLARMSWLPAMPISGSGEAAFHPIWAEDVADCVIAALPGGAHADGRSAPATSWPGRRRSATRSWSHTRCGRSAAAAGS